MGDQVTVRFENLSKSFGRRRRRVRAVHNLNLEVPASQVYGFLGPNGAGKTTTIRMMMDLVRPTAGSVYIFGEHVQHQHHVLEKRVGALVEQARFYGFLTGRRNLEVLGRTRGDLNSDEIDRLLCLVGLQESAGRRVKGYSTGMRQRLGLAAALLGDPELIILDEPTNGLDPAGMQEVRKLIRRLVDDQGKTVFLSSHLLAEVEQVCDRVAIISRGEVIREGAVADLLAGGNQLRLEVEPMHKAAALVSEQWSCTRNARWLSVAASRSESPGIIRMLVENGVNVYQATTVRQSLEEYFLSVTREDDSDA